MAGAVRHHLLLPHRAAAEEAARTVAPDGYRTVLEDPEPGGGGPLRVRVSRVEVPTGLHLAQERTRMAGLAQRLGGDVAGWDLCGPRS